MEIVGIEPAAPKLTREEALERAFIRSQRQLMRERIQAAEQSLIMLDLQETQLMDGVKARLEAAKAVAEAPPVAA